MRLTVTEKRRTQMEEKENRPGDELLENYVPEYICDDYPDFIQNLLTHGITLSNDKWYGTIMIVYD